MTHRYGPSALPVAASDRGARVNRRVLAFFGAAGAHFKASGSDLLQEVAVHFDRIRESPPMAFRGEASWVPSCDALGTLLGDGKTHLDPPLDELSRCFDQLPWRSAPRSQCPASFADGHAFVELIGPEGMVSDQEVRTGLFLLRPDIFYSSHVHEAEEVYLVLSGVGEWQVGDRSFESKGPGEVIHHAPLAPHAIRTGSRGVLTLWAWRGDISFDSYRFV